MLIKEENIYPVIFGGGAEFDCAQKLIESWGVGENFCGRATVQQTVSVMHQIDIFIGNDTGTIHMAASAGISCVGVYSSRNKPILWNPYGEGHTIIRKHDQFECAECEMETCPYDNACINAITVDEVFNNARQCLKMMEIR